MVAERSPNATRKADIAVLLFAMVFPAALTYVYFTALDDAAKSIQYLVFGSLKGLQFVFPLVWVILVQRQAVRLRRPSWRGMSVGVGFGLLVLMLMLLMYFFWLLPGGWLDAAGDEIRQKVATLGVNSVVAYAAMGVFYSLLHSLAEEYYWRWFVFGQLRRLVPVAAAVAFSSIAFAAHHVIVLGRFFGYASPMAWLFAAAIALGGAAWAIVYHRTGSLYAVWASHAIVDAAIFLIGYDFVRDTL